MSAETGKRYVWIVYNWGRLVGVFSTQQKAEAYIAQWPDQLGMGWSRFAVDALAQEVQP